MMARYIDANKIDYSVYSLYDGEDLEGNTLYRRSAIAFESDIDEMPTADVVEVVRCKDCIHYGEVGDCEVHPYDDRFGVNYFCADGERKGGTNER